jgi:heme-degrading monooxygenase HmoA
MTIATVTRITNIDSATREPGRALAVAAVDEVRATDGCEAVGLLRGGTENLVVTLWRDQAAYDKWAIDRDKRMAETIRKISASGEPPTVDPPTFYEVDYWK